MKVKNKYSKTHYKKCRHLTFKGASLHQEMWSFGLPTFFVSCLLKIESRRAPRPRRRGYLVSSFIFETARSSDIWEIIDTYNQIHQNLFNKTTFTVLLNSSNGLYSTHIDHKLLENTSRMRWFTLACSVTAHACYFKLSSRSHEILATGIFYDPFYVLYLKN